MESNRLGAAVIGFAVSFGLSMGAIFPVLAADGAPGGNGNGGGAATINNQAPLTGGNGGNGTFGGTGGSGGIGASVTGSGASSNSSSITAAPVVAAETASAAFLAVAWAGRAARVPNLQRAARHSLIPAR